MVAMRATQRLFSLAVMIFISSGAFAQMHHAGPAMNYHEVNSRLVTGGHFVGDGISELQGKGVNVVIDLRDEPPEGQAEKLAGAGLEWINVPVVWKDPRLEDFKRFVEVMGEHEGDKVLVQCQANYRASAMTYLYRVLIDEVPEEAARKDLNAVWEPEGRWREYMDSVIDSHGAY